MVAKRDLVAKRDSIGKTGKNGIILVMEKVTMVTITVGWIHFS
jgi:hypothetical protein